MSSSLDIVFNGKLHSFQQQVVDWAEKNKCGIIGLDMGLGKTVIAISLLCRKHFKNTIIVLPLSVLQQWKASLSKFTNLTDNQIAIYQGRKRDSINISKYPVVLTTYDTVRYDMQNVDSILYKNRKIFDAIILDEAHRIRNKGTQTYITCDKLAKNIFNRWLLTGTTIHNKLSDFLNLCIFLGSPLKQTTEKNIKKLKKEYYYRLTKAECELNLPEKIFYQHNLDFSPVHEEIYVNLLNETRELYNSYTSNRQKQTFCRLITKIMRLRQCCNHIDASLDEYFYSLPENRHDDMSSSKFDKAIEIIQQTHGDKILIFSQWKLTLNLFAKQLDGKNIKYLQYDGSMSLDEKNYVLDEFKDNDVPVLLITIHSGGVGLDMSYANHIIILDSWWNQALEDQAIDRVYRIGQTKKVEVHRMYINGTIEKWVSQMKIEKKEIDDTFHNNSDIYNPKKIELTSLLHKYITNIIKEEADN